MLKRSTMKKLTLLTLGLLIGSISCKKQGLEQLEDYSSWMHYAGTPSGVRYSSNTQINTQNVKQLKKVWEFSSEDKDPQNRSQNQCNPIIVDGVVYGTSPRSKLLALKADTGIPIWVFDPLKLQEGDGEDPMRFYKVNRGVTYWKSESSERLFYNVGRYIYAIDLQTGTLIENFGTNGRIDLQEGLGRPPKTFNPFVVSTTPAVIYKNLLISGSRVAESIDAAPGHIRAYDVISGEQQWIFHTIPQEGELHYESWPDPKAYQRLGGANNWAGMSIDHTRGVVYVPLGSVSGDFYGGFRAGENLYGNSLVALNASTGEYLWHYQTVHHDLWDRDLPANPNLFSMEVNGKQTDVVAQISKQGYVFLFDRADGTPIFEIKETPVPTHGLEGEEPWPTQPTPTIIEPFADQYFSRDEVGGLDSLEHQRLLELYDRVPYRNLFDPPSIAGNWIFPGFDGGGEWGGAAVDIQTAVLYVNSTRLPWLMEMQEVNQHSMDRSVGEHIYYNNCAACHGTKLEGKGEAYPTLVGVFDRLSEKEIRSTIDNGLGMMPSFMGIDQEDKKALLEYIKNPTVEKRSKEPNQITQNSHYKLPYQMNGYNRFLDKDGYPGIKPPWGTLNALDLKSGKLLWKVPLGNHEELSIDAVERTGTENYGGPLVTKGGLVIIAATKDSKIHAYDKQTGELLWEAALPVPGYATPATYLYQGKQYIVIACGGGKIGSPSGDSYVAFALEDH